jgi:glycosyltransferase involved in cell wall biosynthesis
VNTAVSLYGHLSSSIGLGAAARNTIDVLIARGDSFASINVVPMATPTQQPMGASLRVLPSGVRPPGRVNVFHLNPPQINELLNSPYAPLIPYARLKVSVPFWELSALPSTWTAVLDTMDAVLAPSVFLKDVIERALPHKRVLHFPQGVLIPPVIVPDRERWRMAPGTTVFVCGLDLRSDIRRKNPMGVVEVFRRAFPGGESVELLIHANHIDLPDLASDAAEIRSVVGDRVRLVEGPLDREGVLSLYASADVCVSLHRAEGLGLGMLEAMALGTAVIATGYSGNMDFTDDRVAAIVGYRLVPVRTSCPSYEVGVAGPGQQWAEPDMTEAVAAMRSLHERPELRRQLGAAGRIRAAEVNARHAEGRVFDEVYEMQRAIALLPERWWHGQRMAFGQRSIRARRAAVRLLRAAHLKAPAPPSELARESRQDEMPLGYPLVTGPQGLVDADVPPVLRACP